MDLNSDSFEGLPGADLIRAGINDLAQGRISEPALLVLVGQPRLESCGVQANFTRPPGITQPRVTHALYELVENRCGRDAHSQYNALLRRLTSFLHALENEIWKKQELAGPV